MSAPCLSIDALKKALLASAELVEEDNRVFVVVGACALLAVADDLGVKGSLLVTFDIDLYPLHREKLPNMDEFDEAVGEGSLFHMKNGFFVERLGKWTVRDQPEGWLERARVVEVGKVKAYCLAIVDLAINKLNVGRPKDIVFVEELLRQGLVSVDAIREIVESTKCVPHVRKNVTERLAAIEPSK